MWFKRISQQYNLLLDYRKPCRIVPSDHISPSYRLIEFPNGERAEVGQWRIKHRNILKVMDPISDIYCNSCGQIGSDPKTCEHCGAEIL